jgi:hypothetical protein
MTNTTTILELGNLLIIVGFPLLAGVIGFLSYLRGHFNHLDKVREMKEREATQNREMYINIIVQKTISVEIKEIHDMIKELTTRIDNLFALLNHDR